MLTEELKNRIRKIFESPRYYGRKLTNEEIEEIANNLLAFANNVFKKFKGRDN